MIDSQLKVELLFPWLAGWDARIQNGRTKRKGSDIRLPFSQYLQTASLEVCRGKWDFKNKKHKPSPCIREDGHKFAESPDRLLRGQALKSSDWLSAITITTFFGKKHRAGAAAPIEKQLRNAEAVSSFCTERFFCGDHSSETVRIFLKK